MNVNSRWVAGALVGLLGCASTRVSSQAPLQPDVHCPASTTEPPREDPVLAIVDGHPLVRSDLVGHSVAYAVTRAAIPDAAERARREPEIEWMALDAWITDAVVAAEASRRALPDDPAMTELALQEIARRRHATPQEVIAQVVAAGVTEQAYRDELAAQFRLVRLSSQYIVPRVQVRDEEIEAMWRHTPEPRPPLDPTRDAIRRGLLQQRAECETRAWVEALRREHGVEVLMRRPPETALPAHAPPHGMVPRDRVIFVGNTAVSTAALQATLPAAPRIALDDDGQLPETLRDAMRSLYDDRGYVQASVTNAPEAVDACDPMVAHEVVAIYEGPRFRVGTIELRELDAAGHAVGPAVNHVQVQGALHLRPHAFFSRATLVSDVQTVRAAYAHSHDPEVTVTPDTHVMPGDLLNVTLTVTRPAH